KRRDTRDDLLTALVSQGGDGGLTELELVSMTFGLIFSGHETTTHLVGNGVLSLLDHPAELAKLGANPALITRAREEMLRDRRRRRGNAALRRAGRGPPAPGHHRR